MTDEKHDRIFSSVGEMFFNENKPGILGINKKPLKIKGKPLIKRQTKELLELMKKEEFRNLILHKMEELKYFFQIDLLESKG